MKHTSQLPYVLFEIKGGRYAVASENVREILLMPQVVRVPNAPPEVRGVINLRGGVLKLVDLRLKLGLPSALDELNALVQLLRDREQDHRNWLAELEACVRENRAFKLARDHHKCKFGLWYDQFKTQDSLLRMTLQKMDRPHQLIHAAADEVLRKVETGDVAAALELLDSKRGNELAALIKLFEETRTILSEHHREVAIVLRRREKCFAITVDQVEAVERIPEDCIEPMSANLLCGGGNPYCRVAKRTKTGQTVLLLEEDFFFATEAAQ